jgi:hypothetical protein
MEHIIHKTLLFAQRHFAFTKMCGLLCVSHLLDIPSISPHHIPTGFGFPIKQTKIGVLWIDAGKKGKPFGSLIDYG